MSDRLTLADSERSRRDILTFAPLLDELGVLVAEHARRRASHISEVG